MKIIHKARDDDTDRPPAEQGKWNAIVRKDYLDFVCNDAGEVLDVTRDTADYITSLRSGKWKRVVPEAGVYPTTTEARNDAIIRAEARIREKDYDLLENCEYFVTQVLTGTGQSRQFMNVVGQAVGSAGASVGSLFLP